MTQTMKISQARDEFNQLVNRVYRKETRVLVEKSGIPVAAIVSAGDLEELQKMEERRAESFKIIDKMRAAFKETPEGELEEEIDKAIADVRSDNKDSQRQNG
jgi:prevent-host-death family protein